MFDIKWIRDNPETFDAGLTKRGISPGGDVRFASDLIALDDARRTVITALQEKQARRNAASKEIGKAKGAKDEALATKLMDEVAALKETIAKGEQDERERNAELKDVLSVIPNLPREDVPVGSTVRVALTGSRVEDHGDPSQYPQPFQGQELRVSRSHANTVQHSPGHESSPCVRRTIATGVDFTQEAW